jgi:hypothetical protein
VRRLPFGQVYDLRGRWLVAGHESHSEATPLSQGGRAWLKLTGRSCPGIVVIWRIQRAIVRLRVIEQRN